MDLLLAMLGREAGPPSGRLGRAAWDELQSDACLHQVAPLLWHRLNERGVAGRAPTDVLRRLLDLHTLEALRARARRDQLAGVLRALRTRDVPAILLKGIYLAEHVYPSAALRPMGDIDLLIPDDAFDRAVDALVDAGYDRPDDSSWAAYRDHRHLPPLRRRGYLTVELHVGIEPCMPPFGLPLPAVWSRAYPVPAAGECALALAPEDLLLHLATHMGRSHLLGVSLVSVCDVAIWLERFGESADWDAVVARAQESGTRRFVYAALELARAALGSGVPMEVRRALRGDADDDAVAHAVQTLGWPRDFPRGPLGLLTAQPTAWGGIRRLVRLLLVEPLSDGDRHAAGSMTPSMILARWVAAVRYLLAPSSVRALRRQTTRVRRLREWALDPGPHAERAYARSASRPLMRPAPGSPPSVRSA